MCLVGLFIPIPQASSFAKLKQKKKPPKNKNETTNYKLLGKQTLEFDF